MNTQYPHKWWSTLKSVVFGSRSDSSLPPHIGAGGSLVSESVGKADMLSAHALEMGQEARIVQIDFSAACDRVNHQEILFKLCSVGVEGSVLSVLT